MTEQNETQTEETPKSDDNEDPKHLEQSMSEEEKLEETGPDDRSV